MAHHDRGPGVGRTRVGCAGGTAASILMGVLSNPDSWLLSIDKLDPCNLERATQRCDRWFVGGHDSRRSLETLDCGE